MSVLVTGGSGYIGSQTVWDLVQSGEDTVIIDNLSTGRRESIQQHVRLYCGDFGDPAFVGSVLKAHEVDSIFHIAGTVGQKDGSQQAQYFENNDTKARRMIECAAEHGVKNFLLSSTSAVYDDPGGDGVVTEHSPIRPATDYGRSKLMAEQFLSDFCSDHAINYAIIRYFNVAGADPEGRCGPSSPTTTDVVRIAAEVASGRRDVFEIFGDNYSTADGTCVRDFVHVKDVSKIHQLALQRLRSGPTRLVLNCGSERGHSILDVVRTCERLAGRRIPTAVADPRTGDIPTLISDCASARLELGWIPQFSDISAIVKTALDWEERHSH